MAKGTVHLTKLAGAERLLRAAIRIYFADEDALAVHTVASAAYRVLSDIKSHRGKDEIADYHKTTLFYVVRDYRRGTLPMHFTNDPDAMKAIQELAERLPITENSKFEDLRVSISNDTARKWWADRNRVYNFLKHADRDPRDSMSLSEVDNLHLLMQAVSTYNDLVPPGLRPEGLVLWVYCNVETGTAEQLPLRYRSMVQEMLMLTPAQRLNYCSKTLRVMGRESN